MDNHDGCMAVVTAQEEKICNFLCIFSDETTTYMKICKFHLNLPGNSTVQKLYEEVSAKRNYKYGTFLLAVLLNEEEILIDYACDDTLAEVLNDSKEKRNNFLIKPIEGKDPVTLIVDTITPIEQDSEDTASYAGTFFQQQEEMAGTGKKSYAMPSSTSYASYSSAISSQPQQSDTGYVGLVNQAMTCYLNSLMQTLFMTPEFRNALYRWRYKGNKTDASKSIPYQLQKLFLKLETSKKKAVETTDLTKSFGWDSSEAWQQHDVQELCRVMFDALEETLKNTDQFNLINQLYQGEMKDYVKCLNCGHENSRCDNYLDISVDIRPFGSEESHSSLNEALQAFITPETLDGNNQYFCAKCNSKQDAHKGLKFLSFPYLLTIQLKRFTFDYNTLQRIKLHDRLTFPFHMDLKDYLHEDNVLSKESTSLDNHEEYADEDTKDYEENLLPGLQNGEIQESPNKYELFSVLIHSGSALGGHYYAYIKSFDDGKWYRFNDQHVTEASEEDIEKSFGGADKYRSAVYYSNTSSSSTNAYMLMYRKIDKLTNKQFIQKTEWSKSLTELCNYVLKDEEDEYTKKERLKSICKVRLFCYHPKTGEKIESNLEVHKDKTMSEATELAWKTLEMDNVIPLCQCRLVKYDDYNNSFERSFENDQDTIVFDLLGGVRLSYGFDMLLEWRDRDQTFHVYEPGGTTLKVYLIDLEEVEMDEPRTVHVPLSFTITQLKDRLEEITGLSAETMRVVVWKEYHDFNVMETGKRTLKMEGFYKSAKIFVEGLCEADRELEFKKSKFYERLDIFNHTIKLKVTLPFKDENSNENKEISISIDKRTTLRNLKTKIQQQIGVDAEMFSVYRMYSNKQEFECVRYDEQLTSCLTDNKIIVKLGRALKSGESRKKVFLLNTKEIEYTKLLMEVIVYPNLSIESLKVDQIMPELLKQNISVPLERIRVRKKSYKNPSRIYQNEIIFEKDLSILSSSEFFVEILSEKDVIVSEDYLSIYVKRWHPETMEFSPFDEVVLYKETTVKNLKHQLELKSGIPSEMIHIAKGRGMFPCDVSILDIHHELDWNPIANRLGEYPMSICDDGSVIYYRNSSEVLKTMTDDERREIRNKENGRKAKSSSTSYRKEKALKIYTNGASK